MSKESCYPQSSGCCAEDMNNTPVIENVQKTSTSLTCRDVLGAWKVRWGIGRMNYTVNPGLYAVGKPKSDSPVLVSANYKMTFDILRKNLSGLDGWLLILDTNGVNVWCAAGKGTFGTEELINRIEIVRLSEVVTHKNLILPQLGAPGVNSNEVKQRTGFSVTFGPVRANDIQAFISSGNKATKEMRLVKFTFKDRLVLTPMEIVPAAKMSLPIFGVLFLTNQFAKRPFDKHDIIAYSGAVLTGAVLTPLLLPYIPGKAFAWKGFVAGLCWTAGSLWVSKRFAPGNRLLSAGQLLLFPAISSFFAMNFTGASTYTSPSGVKREMQKALPLIIGAATIGAALTFGVHLFGRRKK